MKFIQSYKKEFLSFLSCFLLFLCIFFVTYRLVLHSYKESFIKNSALILNHIAKLHPELESEIMESFHQDSFNYDTALLQKYGFLDEEVLSNLSFVSSVEVQTKQIIFWSFFISFCLFFFLVLCFYIPKERRIHELHTYLFRVLKNDYDMNLKDYQEDSISTFKSDLLKVTNKLRNISEISIQDKKNLEKTLSDISHQLRTPLTSLSIINDVLRHQNLSLNEQLNFLNQQKEQLERMEWLIVALLKMSQIDSGTIVFQKSEESIARIIESALKPSLISLELKQIDLNIDVSSELVCFLDFHWTVEAIVNLIKNAMEHTKEGGYLKIKASDNPLYVEITLEDNGSGISKEDIPHIFERFYKGKGKSDSIGIGLNLSKTIIEKQNGTIHVESKLGEGTKFIIHFYKVTI